MSKKLKKYTERFEEVMQGFIQTMHSSQPNLPDITMAQYLVLQNLLKKDNCKMSDLSKAMKVTLPNMTGLIDRIEKEGYAKRRQDHKDRRITRIGLSTKGRRTIKKVKQKKQQHISSILAKVSNKDRRKLLEIMEKIANKLKKTCAIITLLILCSGASFASNTLSLENFIKTAIKNNPKYQISAQEYLIALEQNKSANSLEDWNLIASSYFNEATNSSASTFSPAYQKTIGYNIGLEKYIAKTGTAIKIEHNNTRIKARYSGAAGSFFPSTPYYSSDLALTITQPLLRNAFGLTTKNALKMANYSLEIAQIKLAEDWEGFIAKCREEYLKWQLSQRNLSNYQDKLEKVKKQQSLIKRQVKLGLSEQLDLVQIEQKVQAYKILVEQAQLTHKMQTKTIMGLISKEKLSSSNYKPEKFSQDKEVLEQEQATAYILSNSNLKQTTDLLVAIQKTNLESKENEQLLNLNLIGQYKPKAFSYGFKDSITKIGEQSEASITLSASKSLGNNKAQAGAKEAKNKYQKALEEKNNILLDAQVGLANLYTSLKHLNKMLQLSRQNLNLAKERLKLEQIKYNQGRSSIFFVLQAEDDFLQADNAYTETVFNREKVINQIKAFTDRYLVEYQDVLKI